MSRTVFAGPCARGTVAQEIYYLPFRMLYFQYFLEKMATLCYTYHVKLCAKQLICSKENNNI